MLWEDVPLRPPPASVCGRPNCTSAALVSVLLCYSGDREISWVVYTARTEVAPHSGAERPAHKHRINIACRSRTTHAFPLHRARGRGGGGSSDGADDDDGGDDDTQKGLDSVEEEAGEADSLLAE
jgi:hypothetical protein